MSDLTDAATNLSNAATRANKTTDFFDDVTTLGPTSTVKNPNNNKTVPSVQKQVKDLFDSLPADDSVDALEAAAIAVGAKYDEVIATTNTTTVLDDVLYIYDASEQITYAKPADVGAGEVIVSVTSEVLTTDASSYLLEASDKSPQNSLLSAAVESDAPIGSCFLISDMSDGKYTVVADADTGGWYISMTSLNKKLRHIYDDTLVASQMIQFTYTGDNASILQPAYDYYATEFQANNVIEFHLPDKQIQLSQLKVANEFLYNDTQKWQTFVGGNIVHASDTLFMFTSRDAATANCLKFKGTHFFDVDDGFALFDADTIRRVSFEGACFTGVNTAIYSSAYAQSYYFDSACLVRQGLGWFIDINNGFDFSYAGNIVEHRESFWRTRSTTADPACNSFKLRDSLIEGLTGKAVEWGACYACLIDGTYMEQNAGGYIDASISSSLHKGLTITNNSIQPSPAQVAAGHRPIKWGASAVELKSGGNASTGNLHDIEGTSAFVDMTGDYAAGELYNGYEIESVVGRNPIGFAKYSRGSRSYVAFNDRYEGTDPFLRGRVTGGNGYAVEVSGELAPIYDMYGTINPEVSPATYGNRKWAKGSILKLSSPVVGGGVGVEYVITGYICTTSGSGGASGTDRWEAMRAPTGN